MQNLPVLVVEDDPDLLEALHTTLRLAGYQGLAAANGEEALRLLQAQAVGLVVSDVQMRPMDGHALLQAIRRDYPQIPVVLMTAYGEIGQAVAAMRAGASDYLLKPFDHKSLLAQVERYLLPVPADAQSEMVAEDVRTHALLSLAKKVAQSNATVMLTGESGSGKEVLARYIHRHSARAGQPFVAINCAAIPENLLEATLFGYEKGAFTGAMQSQAGKFEQAEGGTLLLDEISEMPLGLQAKLLRVLQEREVERVGGRKPVKLDIRLIATSNRTMLEQVHAGEFREDLYYRLNVFPLEIPPLRERPQDIVPLAQRFLDRAMQTGSTRCTLSQSAVERLQQYAWPGNVRELENVIQRAMILATGAIEAAHLNLPAGSPDPVLPAATAADPTPMRDIKSLEREHILQTLAAVNGSRKLAVQRLGISERTLRYKLQQYRLAQC
ncbi:sigma-54-dependent transcriptional regulator [Nitrosomonas halophila]|uniref:Two-component system, response regulator FlrC n=1 Tax=Nitrosomonas halophila TaxID=44576 RepID=A0A1H3K7T2_9PROT|nr:sigma-54 dependent transcriptional regulator [Nitrosomonas halophila]SDY48262.1 two-component system, response regulator FlrC [Nitrosomonas halophila]